MQPIRGRSYCMALPADNRRAWGECSLFAGEREEFERGQVVNPAGFSGVIRNLGDPPASYSLPRLTTALLTFVSG